MKPLSATILAITLLSPALTASEPFFSEDFESLSTGTALSHDSGTIRAFGDYTGKQELSVNIVDHEGNKMLHISDSGDGWCGTKSIKLRESTNSPVRTFSFKFIEKNTSIENAFAISLGTWLAADKEAARWKLTGGNVFAKPRYQPNTLCVADLVINNSDQPVTVGTTSLPAHTHTLFVNGQQVGRPQEVKLVAGLESGKAIENIYFRTFSTQTQDVLIDDIEVRTGTYISPLPEQPATVIKSDDSYR